LANPGLTVNACQMVARSFAGQWRGLPEPERLRLNQIWMTAQPLTGATSLRGPVVSQVETAIWMVTTTGTGRSLLLLSVKEDFLGDVPEAKP
jgi:hypothetical protein